MWNWLQASFDIIGKLGCNQYWIDIKCAAVISIDSKALCKVIQNGKEIKKFNGSSYGCGVDLAGLMMGGACSGQKLPKKVLLTGPKGSGKTTLLYFWCQNMIMDTLPTDSFNVETVTRPRMGPIIIWDVTDTARRRQFFHGTDAIVYMFESGDNTDLTAVKADLKTLLSDRDLHNLPLLLVISKQDLSDMSSEKAENMQNTLDLTNNTHYACVRTRKDDTETYRQAFQHLCDIIHSDSAVC